MAVLVTSAAACGGGARPAGGPEPAGMQHAEQQGSLHGLSYRLHLPQPGPPLPPLLVMLHGCLQDAASFAAATRTLEQAGTAIVLFPEQSAAANPQRCWNWFDPANRHRDGGEAAAIAALTRQLAAEHGADPARVYVAGISAGGMMAAVMAATYPDLYAALGVHSAGAFPTAASVAEALAVMRGEGLDEGSAAAAGDAALAAMGDRRRSMPAVIVHGSEDAVVSPANARQAMHAWWRVHQRATGLAAPPAVSLETGSSNGRDWTVERWGSLPGGPLLLEQWEVHGLGHAWSGGVDGGSYADPAGPDAAGIMLRFLFQQRQP
jgi:poly(hydroxyalkanoate) depolymerase family esterase